jgi:hypothetical protein
MKVCGRLTILLWAIQSVLSNFKIWAPNFIAAKYKDTPLVYKLSSFGKVPYGHDITGFLKVPVPSNGCGKTISVQGERDLKTPLILFIERGNCTFMEKIINSQKIQAAMVVFLDDRVEDVAYIVPYAEKPLEVNIPSILLSRDVGLNLFNDVLNSHSNLTVTASVEFQLQKSEHSNIQYSLNLNERELLETFFELMYFYPDLKQHIKLEASYNIKPMLHGSILDSLTRCANVLTYCERREDGKVPAKKEDHPLYESMRQICLMREKPDQWYNYVSRFYSDCTGVDQDKKSWLVLELKKCSDDILAEDKPTKEIIDKCMSDLDPATDVVKAGSKLEQYLQANHQLRSMLESPVKPTVSINGQHIVGNIKSIDLLKNFCQSLSLKPKECEEIEKIKTKDVVIEKESFSLGHALVFIVKMILIGLVICVAFYMFYKIKLKKEMEKKMNTEVDSALSNYYMQNKGSFDNPVTEEAHGNGLTYEDDRTLEYPDEKDD